MTFKEEKKVSTSTTSTFAENGIFDKVQEDEPAEDDIESDDEQSWDEGLDPNLNDDSWIGNRGSNKNPTRGVKGTYASPKGTQAGPKSTQVASKGTPGCPKSIQVASKGSQVVVKK